jgi:transposase InsO family protein
MLCFYEAGPQEGVLTDTVAAADVQKAAVTTPFGMFEFLCMPFRLKNAGQSFQRLMDTVTADLAAAFAYLDDVIIASSPADHEAAVQLVLERLRHHGLVLNLDKCVFSQPEVEFLGHQVSARGVELLEDHVATIRDFQPPADKQQLQRFLGMVNFYRRFLPGAAGVLKPLTDALQGPGGKNRKLNWTAAMDAAFCKIKQLLCEATCLAHTDPAAAISLAVDASNTHVGAVLQQQHAGGWQPLAFYSKKLDSKQRCYSAFDRELLAAYLAIRHFRCLLEGRQFAILTDHKLLMFEIHCISELWLARQQRQLSYLAEFTSDFRHVPGVDNVVADALSRPGDGGGMDSSTPGADLTSVATCPGQLDFTRPGPQSSHPATAAVCSLDGVGGVDFAVMATEQLSCTDCKVMEQSAVLKLKFFKGIHYQLLCDYSTDSPQPLVPASQRKAVFAAMHGVAHPGVRATRRLISTRFVWPKMAADIAAWWRDCVQCNVSKVTTHVRAAVEPIDLLPRHFAHLHVDMVGPFPVSAKGNRYLFTVIDRSTRWVEAVPVPDMSTATCSAALFSGWIGRYGVPDRLTSDRGAQFTSEVWAALCRRLSISHIMTTAYHPQSNGMVERFHRHLKEALRARLAAATTDWEFHLPWVLLGIRAAPKDDSNVSAAEAVFGQPLMLPGQL